MPLCIFYTFCSAKGFTIEVIFVSGGAFSFDKIENYETRWSYYCLKNPFFLYLDLTVSDLSGFSLCTSHWGVLTSQKYILSQLKIWFEWDWIFTCVTHHYLSVFLCSTSKLHFLHKSTSNITWTLQNNKTCPSALHVIHNNFKHNHKINNP